MNQQKNQGFRFGLKALLYLVVLIAVGIVAYLNGYHDGEHHMMNRWLEKTTAMPPTTAAQNNPNPTP